ncbi:TfoX/Sxy family protein [Paracoccus xiamenensis]|uniref:TfoX/Sxy family protein n=1 Tax=Paracoccus xiamenensis TaxID=2714901 RepID=UPI0014099100|nr:TfoX/Sxy family protein [Paracoccus xiamenensis]NHF72968.1 TfoX/Sxy family protein [Paracoccus xiamenensis]
MAYDWLLATRVRDLLDGMGGAAELQMMGALCFLRRGHICCGVTGERLMVRLGADGAVEALADPQVAPLGIGGGRAPKGFVTVAPEALAETQALAEWVARGVRFADGLPDKPQRRK